MLPVGNSFKLCIVVYWRAQVCALLYAAENKEAEQWGKTIKCEVNTKTNELQVFRAAMPGSKDITPETDRVQENLDELRKNAGKFLFRDYDTDALLYLSVPEEYIPILYDATAETFPLLKGRLPEPTFKCLSQILNGVPYDQVKKNTFEDNREVFSDDIELAADNPQTGLVKIESEEDLARMLEAPLEKWRVFLHPQQRCLAYRHYAGPALVLGGAGTGKSVVALHHAKFLATDSPKDHSILYTTYTTDLTDDLKNRLRSICSDEEYAKITVVNLDALIYNLLRTIQRINRRKYIQFQYKDEELIKVWKKAIEQSGIEMDNGINARFFMDEWVQVVQAQDIVQMEDYLAVDRQGRGKRIDRKTREKLWVVFDNYRQIMEEKGWIDGDAAANYCCHQIKANPSIRHYDSVIVDEAPDFGPAQFRLLRALCGEPHADDIYITGDPRQRIYTNKPKNLVLSRCDINVRGRSESLIWNYRTTGNILKWANRLLRDIECDDLDGGIAEINATASAVEGDMPELRKFTANNQETNYVTEKISGLIAKGVRPGEIAVIARTNRALSWCAQVLKESGIPVADPGKGSEKADAVHFLTMHKSKGLEFSHVFIIGVNKDDIPNRMSLDSAQDAEERKRRINQEKQCCTWR